MTFDTYFEIDSHNFICDSMIELKFFHLNHILKMRGHSIIYYLVAN